MARIQTELKIEASPKHKLHFQIIIVGWLVLVFVFFTSCNDDAHFPTYDGPTNQLFSLLPQEYTGISFTNVVNDAPDRGLQFYDYFYNGAGVAVGDINNDGLDDVFFTGNDANNELYLNKGGLTFEKISKEAKIQTNKWSTGVTMVDINDDGYLDIYVCNSGPYLPEENTANELFINNGDNTFTEQAYKFGIADGSRSSQAAFFDYDNDGDLDLWVLNHGLRNRGGSAPEWFKRAEEISSSDFNRECSTLYNNDGNNQFTDVSKEAGIQKIGFGLGITIRDFNEDGLLDVYCANDFFIPDFLWVNQGDGTFQDDVKKKFRHVPYYSMGCDAADFNNDGLTDLVVVDMTPSDHVRNKTLMASMDVKGYLYLTELKQFNPQYMFNTLNVNQGFGVMSDIALFAGVAQTDWSWAPLLADFDNDGYKDLLVTNGFRKDTKNNDWKNELGRIRANKGENYSPQDYYDHLQTADVSPVPNQIFQNINGLQFETRVADWGFSTPSFSNGAAYSDLDNDGDLDLVINNLDQAAFVYQNNSIQNENHHYIRFKLLSGKNDNAILYSHVKIYTNDGIQRNDVAPVRGYQSSVESEVHFGLGTVDNVDRVEVLWNNGTISEIKNPAIDQTHVIQQQDHKMVTPIEKSKKPMFVNITKKFIVPNFTHVENSFDDFQKEVLLPHRQSMIGPAIAVGDINADGLEDFYVGGAKNQAGMAYVQQANAPFIEVENLDFQKDAFYEDCGAKFLDVNMDGNLDLYVASGGGGDFENEVGKMQDRIYMNDGKGNFTLAKNILPTIKSSTKAIAPMDWDNDGDIDLFVGGRTKPGRYPEAPLSYLLVNENGRYKDMTDELAPELRKAGMVTDAVWDDINANGLKDLVIVGEWMPITIFEQNGGKFTNQTGQHGLNETAGWWSSIHKNDFDNDGDADFIVGNIGLNNKFHPSIEKPLYVYANDFDNNGTMDIVLSKIYNGQKVPVRGKECSSAQMPFLWDKFPTFEGFATASLEEIYEEEELNTAIHYTAYDFSSILLKNIEGRFSKEALPLEAQLFPINGIVSKDFNGDGFMDIVVAGNMFQTEVETPQYDAGKGLFLKGAENGTFTTQLQMEYSGLFLSDDVKSLELIHLGPSQFPAILVGNNNGPINLIVYQ